MSVKVLIEHRLEFLSIKGGCTGSSESTLVKMPHCSKSRRGSYKQVHKTDFGTTYYANSSNMHVQLSSGARCLSLYLCPGDETFQGKLSTLQYGPFGSTT